MAFNRRSSGTTKSAATPRLIKPDPKPVVKKFIKIILFPTVERKMMQVPEAFVRLGPKLSDIVTIETPVGFKRSIQIKRIGDEVWFDKGWNEFAETHSLSEGHLLMFDYKGNSSFSVVIFDVSASEIKYPEEKEFSKIEHFADDTSEETIDFDELLKTVNIKCEDVLTLDDDDETN